MDCIGWLAGMILFGADFPIVTAPDGQFFPCIEFAHDQYYVFWSDRRAQPNSFSVYGSRVSQLGVVFDVNGKVQYTNQARYDVDVAYGGHNFLVVFRDSC